MTMPIIYDQEEPKPRIPDTTADRLAEHFAREQEKKKRQEEKPAPGAPAAPVFLMPGALGW